MSLLRAILARFARLLVRIARTLDPGLPITPHYWSMPERVAALRQRFPGAPEHWLQALASRSIIPDPPPAQHAREPRELPNLGFDDRSERHSRPSPEVAPNRRRPVVQFPAPTSNDRTALVIDRQETGRGAQRDVVVRAAKPRREVPSAPAGRADPRRRTNVHFETELHERRRDAVPSRFPERARRPVPDNDGEPSFGPQEGTLPLSRQMVPPPPVRRTTEDIWPRSRRSPRPPLHFAEAHAQRGFHEPASPANRTARQAPTFAELVGVWPELPPLPVDDVAETSAHADTAFGIEQMIGTWSE